MFPLYHCIGQILNLVSYLAHCLRDISHTSTVRPPSEPYNHYDFADRALQSEHLIDSNFHHGNYHQHVHNSSIAFIH